VAIGCESRLQGSVFEVFVSSMVDHVDVFRVRTRSCSHDYDVGCEESGRDERAVIALQLAKNKYVKLKIFELIYVMRSKPEARKYSNVIFCIGVAYCVLGSFSRTGSFNVIVSRGPFGSKLNSSVSSTRLTPPTLAALTVPEPSSLFLRVDLMELSSRSCVSFLGKLRSESDDEL
jgi:hypothetical protein